MNNNRGNNRRRGRGNNRAQGGGQQLNRIDSRARGNAPQLLEKYKKMAHDAHLNGDRVQEEYYLQFADHYFRVIADQRVRQDEQRPRPSNERWQDSDSDEDGDESEAETGGNDRRYERNDRNDRGGDRSDRGGERNDRGSERKERGGERNDHDNRRDRDVEPAEQIQFVSEGEPIENEADNPFVRDTRSPRAPRGRPRRQRDEGDARTGSEAEVSANGVDPSSLPPAFGTRGDDVGEAQPEAPAPKRRGRPRKVVPTEAVES